ncbi:hypothetical protein [Pontibacter beigongshangensis]|uniref:hypothetical protein n=1 Tax=Pontibacter beigongshangensis TaxID=2574733 RepID=UPI0016506D60|nr:hypothetical protein [Pontibacter beigongshangensis]
MKQTLLFLLLAIGSAASAQQQLPSTLTYSDALSIIQKISGQWHVKKCTWHPEIRKMSEQEGTATHLLSATAITVAEQVEFTEISGTLHKEEGMLRYSRDRQQFEYVPVQGGGGKEIVLYAGHWHAPFKTLLLKGVVRLKGKKVSLGEWRYTFMEDGSFVKDIHYSDKNGNLHLAHRYHYIPVRPATAELQQTVDTSRGRTWQYLPAR